ncbi:MAG: hypothetical protein AAB600_03035 [Patescibacteria group bacterium]
MGGSACRARLRGKRVKSVFFEICGQPPEKEGRKNAKIGISLEEIPDHLRSLKEDDVEYGYLKKMKTFNHERILQYIVIFLVVLNFFVGVGYPSISSLFAKSFPAEIVTINLDGSTKLKQTIVPSIPISLVLPELIARFMFLLPPTLLGIFLIPDFLFVFSKAEAAFFTTHFLPHAVLWFLALISIPFIFRYSEGLSIWKRLFYTYLIAGLIAGMGATAWSTIFTG